MTVVIVLIGRGNTVSKPGKKQILLETVIGGFYSLTKDVMGNQKAGRYFSFIFTFFLFIVFANWWGLLPFVPSIGIIENEEHEVHAEEVHAEEAAEEHVEESCLKGQSCVYNLSNNEVESREHITHLFRAPSSDVSMTVSLALLSVVFTNIFALREKGLLGLITNYFHSFNIIDIIVGFFEMISELGKVISFSFRLFGNIFAGEVLLLVLTNLTFGLATLPFLGLELFIGFIQAFVFMMLTMVFMSIATAHH